MKDIRKKVGMIEDALILHRRRAGSPGVPELLPEKIMTRIREEAMQRESSGPIGARLNRLVWRFAMVTCLIAVLLGVYEMKSEVQDQDQFAAFMMHEDSDLEWVQDLGVL
jgi:hypothetical protein